jgi:3-oxoacyl-[acyl-carrier protein] reductase
MNSRTAPTLAGRVALITGGRRGIGGAIAQRLSAHGAAVVLAAEHDDDEGLEQTRVAIAAAGGQAAALSFDLADGAARQEACQRAGDLFGPIDILVNNAAVNDYQPPSLMDLAFRRVMFEVNLQGPIDLIQQVLPGMRARRWGRILNISSSCVAQTPIPYACPEYFVHGVAVYGASKAALERYSKALAAELHGSGVHVNALAPTNVCVTGVNSEAALDALRRHPDWAESVEVMAEAAYALIEGSFTGLVTRSRDLLQLLQQPLHALDGRTLLGDALSLPELS